MTGPRMTMTAASSSSKDRRNHIKVDEDGDANWWWERSPYGSNSYYFCLVNSSGIANFGSADGAYGVCFGFYI